mgnify:FL=1
MPCLKAKPGTLSLRSRVVLETNRINTRDREKGEIVLSRLVLEIDSRERLRENQKREREREIDSRERPRENQNRERER